MNQSKVWQYIDRCHETNASWREQFNLYGLLAAIGWELDLEDNEAILDMAEELEITNDEVTSGWVAYIYQNRMWSPEMMVANMSFIVEELPSCGSTEEAVEAISDYSKRNKCPEVLIALKDHVETFGGDDWIEGIETHLSEWDSTADDEAFADL